jgi:hypothetical protein
MKKRQHLNPNELQLIGAEFPVFDIQDWRMKGRDDLMLRSYAHGFTSLLSLLTTSPYIFIFPSRHEEPISY